MPLALGQHLRSDSDGLWMLMGLGTAQRTLPGVSGYDMYQVKGMGAGTLSTSQPTGLHTV